jgi:hypothetical protein
MKHSATLYILLYLYLASLVSAVPGGRGTRYCTGYSNSVMLIRITLIRTRILPVTLMRIRFLLVTSVRIRILLSLWSGSGSSLSRWCASGSGSGSYLSIWYGSIRIHNTVSICPAFLYMNIFFLFLIRKIFCSVSLSLFGCSIFLSWICVGARYQDVLFHCIQMQTHPSQLLKSLVKHLMLLAAI